MFALSILAGTLGAGLFCTATLEELPPDQRGKVKRDLLLISIPVVALFFTWFHIWLAIQMMFRPVSFLGIWEYGNTGLGIGWQGVVPRKSKKMARMAFACARPYLLSPRQLLGRVDPIVLCQKIRPQLKRIISASINSISRRHFPVTDRQIPASVHDELVSAAMEKTQESMPTFWREITEILSDSETGIDNDGMIVTVFVQNKELLNHFFLSMGKQEFRFIEHCGAALGFICGVVQLFAYNHLDATGQAVFLPLTGFFLGIFTNWLAIQMCFLPVFPREIYIGGVHVCTIQGLFLKRQKDVAQLYSKLLVDHFFSFDKVVDYLQTQPDLWRRLKAVYVAHNKRVLQHTLGGPLSRLAPLAVGHKRFGVLEDDLQGAVAERIGEATDLHAITSRYIASATDVFRTNAAAMQTMPPDEFENLLHPVFKEDEWILILLGGALGAIVGLAQVHFLKQ